MQKHNLFNRILSLSKYLFFFLLLFLVMQWTVISLYFTSFGQKQELLKKVDKFPLQSLILQKTGVKINSLHIINSNRPYGAMIGVPGAPYLMLSKYLYEKFNTPEMEYVLLHETGHYVLKHSAKEGVLFFIFFGLGSVIIYKIHARKYMLFIILILSLFLGIILLQQGRRHEYEADHFAASKISDPEGMISATKKFQNFYGDHFTYNGNILIMRLFYRSVPYQDRIMMANEEIGRRMKK